MGSLFSKPSLPSYSYVSPPASSPAAAAPSAADNTVKAGSNTGSSTESDAEKVAGVVRRRAMPETILTSFRGVLSPNEWVPARKSLLGE